MICPKCGTINAEWQARCSQCQTDLHAFTVRKELTAQHAQSLRKNLISIFILLVFVILAVIFWPAIQEEYAKRRANPITIEPVALYDQYSSIDFNFHLEFPQGWKFEENITKNDAAKLGTITFSQYSADSLRQNPALSQQSIVVNVYPAAGKSLEIWLQEHGITQESWAKQGIIVKQDRVWGRLISGFAFTYDHGPGPVFKKAYYTNGEYVVEIASNTDNYLSYRRHINRTIGSMRFDER